MSFGKSESETETQMNAFEKQIEDALMTDRKFAQEKIEQFQKLDGSALIDDEPIQYYWDWLDRTEDALNRLSNGDFNICQQCKGPIGEERLLSLPFADLCITCQTKKNQSHRLSVTQYVHIHHQRRCYYVQQQGSFING
jgi:RNA polymerase-binding transcription factor DksA